MTREKIVAKNPGLGHFGISSSKEHRMAAGGLGGVEKDWCGYLCKERHKKRRYVERHSE